LPHPLARGARHHPAHRPAGEVNSASRVKKAVSGGGKGGDWRKNAVFDAKFAKMAGSCPVTDGSEPGTDGCGPVKRVRLMPVIFTASLTVYANCRTRSFECATLSQSTFAISHLAVVEEVIHIYLIKLRSKD